MLLSHLFACVFLNCSELISQSFWLKVQFVSIPSPSGTDGMEWRPTRPTIPERRYLMSREWDWKKQTAFSQIGALSVSDVQLSGERSLLGSETSRFCCVGPLFFFNTHLLFNNGPSWIYDVTLTCSGFIVSGVHHIFVVFVFFQRVLMCWF